MLLLVSLFLYPSRSQKNKLQYKLWFERANQLYDLKDPTAITDSTALDLFLKVASPTNNASRDIAISALIKAGNIHQGYKRFEAANILYNQANSLNLKTDRNEALFYETCLYLGSSHYFSNIIDSAQYYFELASNVVNEYKGNVKLPEIDRLYNSLGAIYFESANYAQAKNYFERGFEFNNIGDADYTELYNGLNSNIASCLMKLNEFERALEILRNLQPLPQQQTILQQNKAHCYFELGKYDSALQIYQKLPRDPGFSGVVALTDMGRIYMQQGQWQEAEILFDSAIAKNKSISLLIKNKEEALAYMYRSDLAQKQGLLDEALDWINEALEEVHLNFEWKKTGDIPQNVANTVSPITLFSILQTKANLMYQKFDQTKQDPFLKGSINAFKKAIETANFIKLNFDNDEAKYFFNEQFQPIYKNAIQLAFEAYTNDKKYAGDYLFLLQHYKGSILYQQLQNNAVKSSIEIPDSTRRREKELKQLLGFYSARLNQTTEEGEATKLQKRLLSIQVDLSRLQKVYQLDEAYSNEVSFNNAEINTLNNLQKKIPASTALIDYYIADSAIFCAVITPDDFLLKKLNYTYLQRERFDSFKNEIYNYTEGKRYEGQESAVALYQQLVAPIWSYVAPFDHWVIIPDGYLYYLPFESLLSDVGKRDYLVLSKTISYHYSMALLLEDQHSNVAVNTSVLGFAPFLKVDENIVKSKFPVLPLSAVEINTIGDKNFVSTIATKDSFLKLYPLYPVIHLATHASISGDSINNWIQFYPSDTNEVNHKLYLPEIYNLDLQQTDLVVLSACETGGGTSATGEGLLSLSRAFMYAGADGIVSTLWKTEDRVSSFLMQRMHQYLKEKKSPSKALQLAKQDLLNSTSIGAQYKTPNYWANFIYVGKIAPEKKRIPVWWWVATTSILLLGYFLYKKSKTSSSLK